MWRHQVGLKRAGPGPGGDAIARQTEAQAVRDVESNVA
jgi:hypothetical protein